MSLKIELKPNERVIVGNALITNDNIRSRFFIDGDVPILREKFIIREEEANTPSKRLYYILLQLYLNNESKLFQDLYIKYVSDLQAAAPSMGIEISEINRFVLSNKYYKALKMATKLIDKEKELFNSIG